MPTTEGGGGQLRNERSTTGGFHCPLSRSLPAIPAARGWERNIERTAIDRSFLSGLVRRDRPLARHHAGRVAVGQPGSVHTDRQNGTCDQVARRTSEAVPRLAPRFFDAHSASIGYILRSGKKICTIRSEPHVANRDGDRTKNSQRRRVGSGIQQPWRVQKAIARNPSEHQVNAVGQDTKIRHKPSPGPPETNGDQQRKQHTQNRSRPQRDERVRIRSM